MRTYHHLSLDERRTLYQMLQAGQSARDIADALARHPSTIYLEIRRNQHLDEHPGFRGYFHVAAHDRTQRRRIIGGKIMRDPVLADYGADRLAAAWSPEQIVGYLRRVDMDGPTVCHETIYHYVYGPHGRPSGLGRLLPSSRRTRRRQVCDLSATRNHAWYHQLFLPAVIALAKGKRGKLQWEAAPVLATRHRPRVGKR
jgi:transposase, IS30 family